MHSRISSWFIVIDSNFWEFFCHSFLKLKRGETTSGKSRETCNREHRFMLLNMIDRLHEFTKLFPKMQRYRFVLRKCTGWFRIADSSSMWPLRLIKRNISCLLNIFSISLYIPVIYFWKFKFWRLWRTACPIWMPATDQRFGKCLRNKLNAAWFNDLILLIDFIIF